MLFRREKPLPSAETPAEPEKAPEYSGEARMMVENIDNSIAYSQNLLGGLDRLAREQIITDSEGLEEIYAPKQIGRMSLKTEHGDTKVFETAGQGLQVRNALKRVITLGLAGSKYGIKGEAGLVDKRKLKEGDEGQRQVLYPEESFEMAKKLGIEIDPYSRDFFKTYAEGKKGVEKIILRKKTEQEADKTAGEILEKRLKDLETKTGLDLVKQKESLAEFKEEKQQHQSILDEKSIARLDDEKIARQKMIEEKQETLNFDLEIIRSPLLEQQKVLAEALADFSSLAAEITSQEKTYQAEIKGLQDKITKISGTKQLKELLGDDIKTWEEEKAQTQINLKDFQQKKEALNLRITELKTNQAEVDAALDRINNIGKTPAELRAEKTAKQLEKLEQQKRNRAYRAPEQMPDFASGSTESEEASSAETARSAGAAAGASPAVSTPESKKPEAKADTALEQPGEIEPAEEKIIKMQTAEWLNLLGLRNAVGQAKTAVENNFKLGEKEFNLTASMTLDQVRQAYTKFIVDFQYNGQKSYLVAAKREADAKLKKIISI